MSENKIQTIKSAPPPSDLPMLGRFDSSGVSFFGRTNYVAALEEKKYIFGIKRSDRGRHFYIIGKSGVGKSKLLELLIRQDIAHGHGLCLIDSHGDIIDDLLNFIPENRLSDVVLIDPSNTQFSVAFNPLVGVNSDFKHQLTQSMTEMMAKLFGAHWTPRLEHVLRFTVLALLDYPQATMRGLISMLTDESYRSKVIEHIGDDMVKRFFVIEFANWSQKFESDTIIPLVNKLSQFLSDPLFKNIFDQKENKIDIRKFMDERKIVLISLCKAKIGEESAIFLGSLFIAKIKQAGMERAQAKNAPLKEFYIYIDEFHDLATGVFENLLSEAKKYGISLTISHQYMAQLPERIRSAVLGSVGTLAVFRVGGSDAEILESELAPIFKVKDMINLGRQEFYIKLMIDGQSYDPFSAETLKILPPHHMSYKSQIIEMSGKKYS